jgi:hypothetical protein
VCWQRRQDAKGSWLGQTAASVAGQAQALLLLLLLLLRLLLLLLLDLKSCWRNCCTIR